MSSPSPCSSSRPLTTSSPRTGNACTATRSILPWTAPTRWRTSGRSWTSSARWTPFIPSSTWRRAASAAANPTKSTRWQRRSLPPTVPCPAAAYGTPTPACIPRIPCSATMSASPLPTGCRAWSRRATTAARFPKPSPCPFTTTGAWPTWSTSGEIFCCGPSAKSTTSSMRIFSTC